MKKIFTLSFGCFLLMMGMAEGQSHLWGTCTSGGVHQSGTIFNTDGNGNNLNKIYTFNGTLMAVPLGELVFANNGKFYGTAEYGPCFSYGGCYSYDPSTGVFTDIHDFDCNPQLGDSVFSGLTIASDGMLYGLCGGGGAHGFGVIFRIDPNTNNYSDIYDFNFNNGAHPLGTLTQLSDGKLYGMTNTGGSLSDGEIFSFNPIDSSLSVLHSFSPIGSGGEPFYGGLLKASNGLLYGMAEYGPNNYGVIFSFNPSTNAYIDVHDFDHTHGYSPLGSLIQASNGLLYGMTASGGSSGYGVIFSFNPSNNSYSDIFNFNMTNGGNPQRGLMQATNGLLFGTAFSGGANNYGVFFSFNIATNTYTDLYDFDAIMGNYPDCSLIEIPDSLTQGIASISNKESITIYPNPATSQLTISNWQGANGKLSITDIIGNEVYNHEYSQLPLANFQIDISQWSNGVYIYQLINNKETFRGKLIKQ